MGILQMLQGVGSLAHYGVVWLTQERLNGDYEWAHWLSAVMHMTVVPVLVVLQYRMHLGAVVPYNSIAVMPT
eukprot:NODE_5567_length_567_cov_14.814672_g4836_i0.p3 GENE.NODE_5567_length_567_cov_14.814672_g4836_i0~~NODE_5567_length_567_cov_14.814672_g4836_i0.p3  ORF type:complete len:72 (+),score=11.54 NODE_5567_length_567_cov_14.814672_g4836_i0:287-502(+)